MAQNKLISIDLKGRSPDLKTKVSNLVKEFKREHLTIWGSMRPADHKLIANENRDIPMFYNPKQVIITYILYFLGLLFLYPLPGDAFMVPMVTKHSLKRYVRMLESHGRNGLFYKMLVLLFRLMILNSKYLYRHLRKRNVLVVVWVVNEDEEYEEVLSFGEDLEGIMTD